MKQKHKEMLIAFLIGLFAVSPMVAVKVREVRGYFAVGGEWFIPLLMAGIIWIWYELNDFD